MVNRPLGVAGVIIVRSEPRAGGSWRAVCTVPNGASRTDGEITRYTRCCETQTTNPYYALWSSVAPFRDPARSQV